MVRHSLIANTRTDCEFDLRDRLFATLHEQREICFVMLCVEDKLLPHLGAIAIFKYKRKLSLLICTEVYVDVTACLIDAFDFVRRRSKSRIQRLVTGLQLKRNQAWLMAQSFR